MKKMALTLTVIMVALLVGIANAQVLTLNSSETLAVPTATKLDLRIVAIDVTSQRMNVTYRFLTSANVPIPQVGSSQVDRTWVCENRAAQLVANCTSAGNPYPCCTGVGTGTGCDPGSTCFTDTFGYAVKTSDAGTQIGKGLRALIWAKMRPDVLTGANNATLP